MLQCVACFFLPLYWPQEIIIREPTTCHTGRLPNSTTSGDWKRLMHSMLMPADIMDTGSTLVYWTQSYFSTLSLTANFHSFPAIYLMILKPKKTEVFLSKVTECMLLALPQPGGTAPECTAWHLVRHSPQAIFRTVIMFWNSWPKIMSG